MPKLINNVKIILVLQHSQTYQDLYLKSTSEVDFSKLGSHRSAKFKTRAMFENRLRKMHLDFYFLPYPRINNSWIYKKCEFKNCKSSWQNTYNIFVPLLSIRLDKQDPQNVNHTGFMLINYISSKYNILSTVFFPLKKSKCSCHILKEHILPKWQFMVFIYHKHYIQNM